MISPKASSRSRSPISDWLPTLIVTPTLLSLATHGAMVFIMATTLNSCQRPPVGFSNEATREIGIVVLQDGDRPEAQVSGEPNDVAPTESISASDVLVTNTPFPETASATLDLPQRDASSEIGPGINLPGGASISDPREPVKSGGGTRPSATGRVGAPQGAAFMGTHADGMKVVFVIDASGSMVSYNALQVAKAALLASLQALDERQQFMIIFYDDSPHVLILRDQTKPTLAYATEINKTLARQSIASVQAGEGTQHLPALNLALKMNPDAIFFLTDADNNTPIWPNDLEKIRKLNNGRAQIHSIEFGQGAELAATSDRGNFLRRLSSQNGGTYRYHDVTKFKPR